MRFKYTDYHIHTRWSHDIKESGPIFEDYIKIAEKQQINICFLDHYELYYIETDPTYPFYDGKISDYLEQIDKIKEQHEFVLSGLEVEYYPDREEQIGNFVDDYKRQFDFLAGTLHETAYGYPVTTRAKLIKLLEIRKIKEVVDKFFDYSEKLINSGIFERICHLDTIFRYINENDLRPSSDIDISEERILNLGRSCIKKGIGIELNLSGLKYPINRTFPSWNVIKKLLKEDAEVFVGSDSHSLSYFRKSIKLVKESYEILNKIRKS